MKVEIVPEPKLTHDPYEECCCGSHLGETAVVTCDDDIKLYVEKLNSGIGSSYNVYIEAGDKKIRVFSTFIGDDGEFCLWVDKNNPQRGGPTL